MEKVRIAKLGTCLLLFIYLFCKQIDGNAQVTPGWLLYEPPGVFQSMVDTMSIDFGWYVIVNYIENRIDIVPEDTAGIVALFILELKEFVGISEKEGHELSECIQKKLRERYNFKTDQQRKPYPSPHGWDFFLYERTIFYELWNNFSDEDMASIFCGFDYLSWRQSKEYHLSDTLTVVNLFADELEKVIAEKMSQPDRDKLITLIHNRLIEDNKQIGGDSQPGKLDGPAYFFQLISIQKLIHQLGEVWESYPPATEMDIFSCLESILTKEQLKAFYLSRWEYIIRYKAAFHVVGRTYSDYQEFLSEIRKRVRNK